MLVGLTVPWAGAAIGLVFGLLLSLAFSEFWVPLIAGTSVGVLYLQVRWTTLILTEWKEPKYIPDSTDKRVVEKKPEDVRAADPTHSGDSVSEPSNTEVRSIEHPSEKPLETSSQVSTGNESDENPGGSSSPT